MTTPSITDEQLLAYAAGSISGPEAQRIAAHVEADPEAARTVALYRLASTRAAADDSVPPSPRAVARARAIFRAQPADRPSWLDRLQEVVAQLVYDSRLQPAAVRQEGAGRFQLGFETDEAEVDLRAEQITGTDHQPVCRVALIGQVSGGEEVGAIDVALLPGADVPVQVTRSDDRSLFVLEVGPGTYDLRLAVGDIGVVIRGIEIG